MSEVRRLVILPCHNEEISITATIRDVRKHIPNAQIWVVDNASTDKTARIATNLGARVLREPRQGKGFAVRRAFSQINVADFDVIFMTDGDDTYSIENYLIAEKELLENGIDMVIGRRVPMKNSDLSRKSPFRRAHTYGNFLFSITHNLLFKSRIQDPLSGWRLMSCAFVNSFLGGASKFEIEAELNAHVFSLACNVREIDVLYSGRTLNSHSKLHTYKDGLRIIRMQFALFRSERPAFAFSMLALPWFIMSLYMFQRALHLQPQFYIELYLPTLVACIGTFLVAALLWVSGIILRSLRLSRVQILRNIYNNVASNKSNIDF